jgi:hypothetical protein
VLIEVRCTLVGVKFFYVGQQEESILERNAVLEVDFGYAVNRVNRANPSTEAAAFAVVKVEPDFLAAVNQQNGCIRAGQYAGFTHNAFVMVYYGTIDPPTTGKHHGLLAVDFRGFYDTGIRNAHFFGDFNSILFVSFFHGITAPF